MNELYLDIETIPSNSEAIRAYIAATVKPPATYKKPESIAEWYKEQAPAAIDEAMSKTGLDGAFGHVCVIGYQFEDNVPQVVYGLDEAEVLTRFNTMLDNDIPRAMHSAVKVVGHNVLSFDLRFLVQRHMVNGIPPHPVINVAVNSKAWDNKAYDTMTQFAGYGNRISLDKLCLALGIESPKGEIDGSMVAKYVADGRIDEVAAYCMRDVAATKAVYQRMTFS